jgi:hypothetical protein
MLSAMLVREIDEPIWEATRKWLESDPNSYFFLVLDELHLQRGTAGTEVAFLIRKLLFRLGLHLPEHRKKLRILASSASLPLDGQEAGASLQYLWDMFGTFGLDIDPELATKKDWAECVVSGSQEPVPSRDTKLSASELVERYCCQMVNCAVQRMLKSTGTELPEHLELPTPVLRLIPGFERSRLRAIFSKRLALILLPQRRELHRWSKLRVAFSATMEMRMPRFTLFVIYGPGRITGWHGTASRFPEVPLAFGCISSYVPWKVCLFHHVCRYRKNPLNFAELSSVSYRSNAANVLVRKEATGVIHAFLSFYTVKLAQSFI